jgi:hypothetical protein
MPKRVPSFKNIHGPFTLVKAIAGLTGFVKLAPGPEKWLAVVVRYCFDPKVQFISRRHHIFVLTILFIILLPADRHHDGVQFFKQCDQTGFIFAI